MGMLSVMPHGPHQSRTHRGIEQTVTTTSSVRQFRGSVEDCQFESSERHLCRSDVMLCELIVEQNIPLAKPDDTLTKGIKLNLKYSNVGNPNVSRYHPTGLVSF